MPAVSSRRFFHQAVQRIARSLASINSATDEQVRVSCRRFCALLLTCAHQFEQLWSLRPKPDASGIFALDHRAFDVIVAIGIYVCESGFQKTSIVLPYLMELLNGLHTCVLRDEIKVHESDRTFLLRL